MGYGSVNVPGVSGPELEAVRALANSALEKANEALEGGGGSGCVLKITFDADFAGQQYTVTDGAGDTKTGTDCNDQCLKDIDCTAKKSHNQMYEQTLFLWSVSVWLYSFPFYSDLFVPLSVVAGCSNSFFHISPHLPQLQSLIHLLVLQLLHTFQILYLSTSPVGVPDIFRHQTHYSY